VFRQNGFRPSVWMVRVLSLCERVEEEEEEWSRSGEEEERERGGEREKIINIC
jgi:hypothetical protein